MGVKNPFLLLIREKEKKLQNSETFKEGNATIISGYLSATHCLEVGLSQGQIQKIQKEGAKSPTLPLERKLHFNWIV